MMKFHTVGLFVTEMDKMVAFYRDVMELKTDWDGAPNAELCSGDIRLIMYSRADFEAMTGTAYGYPERLNGTVELAFEAETFADVDREYARVTGAGAQPVFPPATMPWGQRTSYVADPDGNLIEIGSFGGV